MEFTAVVEFYESGYSSYSNSFAVVHLRAEGPAEATRRLEGMQVRELHPLAEHRDGINVVSLFPGHIHPMVYEAKVEYGLGQYRREYTTRYGDNLIILEG